MKSIKVNFNKWGVDMSDERLIKSKGTNNSKYVSSRIKRVLCWIYYGHYWKTTESSVKEPSTMNRCILCGKLELG